LKGDGLKLCNCSAKKFWRLGAENQKEFNLIHPGIFTEDVGAGAIFEMSRILTTFTMIFGRISHLILPLLLVVHL
jgi:hypothetical protein